MLSRTVLVLSLTLYLAACGTTSQMPNPTPETNIARIDIQPAEVLLIKEGESYPLTAQAFDKDGNPLSADFTWHTSNAAQVTVDHTGVITSRSEAGSSQIHVEAEGVRSAPAHVVIVEVEEGAVLVDDAQVISDPKVVTQEPLQYRVTLQGIPAPPPGTVMLARESAAIAGRVVSSTSQDSNITVLLEFVPMDELFIQHDIDFQFDLSHYELEAADDTASSSTVTRLPDGNLLWHYEYDRILDPLTKPEWDKSFGSGPLECDAAGKVYIKSTIFDVTLSSTPVLHIQDSKSTGQERYLKVHLVGETALTASGGLKVEAGLNGNFSCELVQRFVIPLGGAVSIFIAPAVPIGVGFELNGKFIAANGEAVITGKVGADMDLGFECGPADAACRTINEITPFAELKPEWVIPGAHNMRIEADAGFHALIGVDMQLLRHFNNSLFRLTAGPAGDLKLAMPTTQVADISYASSYDTKIRFAAKIGDDLQEWLDTALKGASATFKFDATLDVLPRRSPFGTFTADRSQVDVNKTVHFTVNLNPDSVHFPLIGYNVSEVRIYHLNEGYPNLLHTIPVSASDQTVFQYDWTAPHSYAGPNEFVAFVVSKFLPYIPLEVNEDSTVHVEVLEQCSPEGQALTKSTTSDDALATQADPCDCEAYQDLQGWDAQANFSYSFTFDDGNIRETHTASGNLSGTLNHEFSENTYAATGWASATGSASLNNREYWYDKGSPVLMTSVVGNAGLIPYAPPTGSRVYINLDLNECRYNVYGLAEITATVTHHWPGDDSYQEPVDVGAFGTNWMPLPFGGLQTLSGGGAYPTYSESAMFFSEVDEWFSTYKTDWHEFLAGEGNLGAADVSWSFTPIPPSTSP